ncbi:MAG: hypothetical protein P8011_05520 [Acidihalobacter sp.]|uniref:hypothetical protein n=1 Tax=Acidihalobacter sp. TaxID=1872108 RepID=UPI00307F578C
MDTSERLERLSPARPAHDRVAENYDLIERRLSEGVRLSAIADVLGMSPKTLSNGLSLLRKAKGSKPTSSPAAKQSKPAPRFGEKVKATPVRKAAPKVSSEKPATSPDHMPAETEPTPKKATDSLDYSPGDPLELGGTWITGAPVRWWDSAEPGDRTPAESPLPMPLRYVLPEEFRPKDMPPVPAEWTTYEIEAKRGDKLTLPDTGSMFRNWWCYVSPRLSSSSRLYGVLPGVDPEAPFGRYPDGRPYKDEQTVWGLGQGGAIRQRSMIDKIPPGELTPVDLFTGFPTVDDTNIGNALLLDPEDSPRIVAWKEAALKCGQPTNPPEVT